MSVPPISKPPRFDATFVDAILTRDAPCGNVFDAAGQVVGVWNARRIDESGSLQCLLRREDHIEHYSCSFPIGKDDIGRRAAALAQLALAHGSRANLAHPDMRLSMASGLAHFGLAPNREESVTVLQDDLEVVAMALGKDNLNHEECTLVARSSGDRLDAIVEPFKQTLDRTAITFIHQTPGTMEWLIPEAWPAIDATFNSDTPLRRLILSVPNHIDAAVAQWAAAPDATPTPEGLLAEWIPRLALTTPEPKHRRLARSLIAHRDAIAKIDASRLPHPRTFNEAFREVAGVRIPLTSATRAAMMIAIMPADWVPVDADEWASAIGLSHAFGPRAVRRLRRTHFPDFIDARGRWYETASRLHNATGRNGDLFHDIASAIRNVSDMTKAFTLQVLNPATNDRPHSDAASALLFGRKTLAGVLALSADWHARQGAMTKEMADISPGVAASNQWGAGLPDFRSGDVDIQVLTRADQLSAEGGHGADADGIDGLHHCVGGYAPACRDGTSRIVSLRRATGARERLSTAEFNITNRLTNPNAVLVQHAGLRNQQPPPEAVAAIEDYARRLVSGRLAIDSAGFHHVEAPNEATIRTGYDPREPGAWERAYAIWRPFLPRPARAWTRDDLIAFCDPEARQSERLAMVRTERPAEAPSTANLNP